MSDKNSVALLGRFSAKRSTGRERVIMEEQRIISVMLSREELRDAIVSQQRGLLAINTRVRLEHGDRVLVDVRAQGTRKRLIVRAEVLYTIPGNEGPLLQCNRADRIALAYLSREDDVVERERRHLRFPCDLPARIRSGRKARSIDGRLIDISATHYRFRFSGVAPTVGIPVDLELLPPRTPQLPRSVLTCVTGQRDDVLILRRVAPRGALLQVRMLLRHAAEQGVCPLPQSEPLR